MRKKPQEKLIDTLNKTIEELQTYHFAIQLGEAHAQSKLKKDSAQYKLAMHFNEQEKQALRDSMNQLRNTIKVLQHVAFAESLSYDFGDNTDILNFKNLYSIFNEDTSSTEDPSDTPEM